MSDQQKSTDTGVEQFGYKQELHRTLRLKDLVIYGMLFMVIIAPMSIFGEIQVASGGMTPLVYLIGIIAIAFTAFCYMQMSSRFPVAGSVYAYVQRGINPHVGFVAGWLILLDYIFIPSLLYSLVAAWCVELVPSIPFFAWIAIFVVINTTINVRGIESTAKADWIMFIIEIGTLLFFIILGLKFVFNGGGTGGLSINPFYQPGKINPGFIASATSIACLSFLGFDGISTLAEETINPKKTVGKGILISLIAIGVVFILQTYVAALILPNWQATDKSTGFFDAAALAGGQAFKIALLVVNILAVGIANTMAAQTATARMLFSMSRDGLIPKIFSKIHPKFKTPYVGAIIIGIFSFIVPIILSVSQLVRLVNFGALSSFVMLNFAVFLFFFIKEKNRGFGAFIKYLVCPWCGIAILIFVFTGFEKLTYIIGITWLIIGLIIGYVKSNGYKNVPEAFKNLY
ncbi:amino acid permease [Clostridium autoethanogenum]|uniref:Low-affinity putrescine importer PlaP n=2 Tax=Clostridium TaxID=1485 RepID=A0A1A6AVT1_9CLOT|nr:MULTISPECIES: APC family permease [Clostridium]OBR94196.1 Low-affinity putrescine importer PlaP [Clostridium ragsdalei P11]RMD01034.1 amino acid permease [Clostridium autoethanogenum]